MAASLDVLAIQAKQAAQVLDTLAGELRQRAGIYGGVVNPRLVSAAGNAHAAHLLATVIADSVALEVEMAAEALDKAAELVRQGWTQGELARDGLGHACRPTDRDATCWCAEGALRRVTGFEGPTMTNDLGNPYTVAFIALTGAARRRAIETGSRNTMQCLPDWNDAEGREAGQVAELMRECAAEMRGQGVPRG